MSLLRIAATRAAAPRLMVRAASTSSVHVVSQRTNASAPLLANIEASWSSLPASEQAEVYQALEEVQKKDWKELTVDEKKAGEYNSRRLAPAGASRAESRSARLWHAAAAGGSNQAAHGDRLG